MINQRFGKLTVVKENGRAPNRSIIYECLCDCGATYIVRGDSLRRGATTCCKKCKYKKTTKHGQSGKSYSKDTASGTYKSWIWMRSRCTNKNHADYPNYGGRGITVCERWDSFENFLEDMGERPEGMSIERIDNSGNYEPSNCKWETMVRQRQNRRTTKLNREKVARIKWLLEVGGHTSKQIAEMFGVSNQCICDIKKGRRWSNVDPMEL